MQSASKNLLRSFVSSSFKRGASNSVRLSGQSLRSLTFNVRKAPLTRTIPTAQMVVRPFAVISVPLESLGESITTAIIQSWLKKPGDPVAVDEAVAVVETDKVNMEVSSKEAGVFVEGLFAAGKEVAIGSPLFKIDTSATAVATTPAQTKTEPPKVDATPKPAAAAPAPAGGASAGTLTVVNVPSFGESVTTGVVGKWMVEKGAFVKTDQPICSLDSDKATVDVASPCNGQLVDQLAAVGAEVAVGAPLFNIMAGVEAPAGAKSAATTTTATTTSSSTSAPSTTKQAATTSSTTKTPASTSTASKDTSSSAKKGPGNRTETRVAMSRMRERIAVRLKESQTVTAMLTTFQECDMSALMDLRNKYKEDFEKKHNVKLGFMSAFVKASTAALAEVPAINAVIDDKTKEIVYRNYVDISVAVASPTGLVVPVLRNTEDMSFADVEKTIVEFGKKAKDKTLTLEEMVGGTFTISNGGVFGSLFGTPIINLPQSAILGVHATKPRAVVVNGKVEARPMMYLALTYDHRLIDGREAVTFLKSVANKIEDPSRLLLDL